MKEKFPAIYKEPIETLQINIGYKCNQACKHCHVNSSPLRTEKMSSEMISLIPKIIEKYKIKTLDITGGAPELHPEFKNLITSLSTKQVDIIDRCNLTIFFEEGYEDLPQFLAKNKVIVTASLPCYEKNNVDFQRGFGVFEKSINAIKILNDLGYGKKENGLKLNLVYNPVSPILPPSQEILEEDYKKILFEKYNIVFNNLYTITNMPINRYEESLKREGKLNTYYKLLKENFNEKNLANLMCKKTISVNWLGEIYDCDFNQQINFRENKGPKTLFDLLNMNMKKLNLKSDHSNKQIKNLSQFEDFYNSYECCEKNNKISTINADDFNSLYKAKPNKILLIDVRENEEFSASAIEGSISFPLSHLEQESDLRFIQKESLSKEVFTICKSGKRSEKASRILSKFKIQSRSIEGGLEKVKRILSD